MTQFYIIRHGETDYNRDGRFQGQTDIPLNDDGRTQSRLIGVRMSGVQLDAIYASDLSRARATAEAVAAGRPILLDPRLREVNVGAVAGMTPQEIGQAFPAVRAAMEQNGGQTPFPGGESAYDVQVRAVAALAEIHQRHPRGQVAIITHGGVVKTIVAAVLGLALSNRHRFVLENCSLTIVEWSGAAMQLRSLNETVHLSQAPRAVRADF